jgi:preprotein translocase subunit Sec63
VKETPSYKKPTANRQSCVKDAVRENKEVVEFFVKKTKRKIMAFKRYRGKTKFIHVPKNDTTSLIVPGAVIRLTDSGATYITKDTNDERLVGIARDNIAVTDTTKKLAVEVPIENGVEWLIDTDSDGGAADTDIGSYCAIDTGDTVNPGATVDINDTAPRLVYITGRKSATQIYGVICKSAFTQDDVTT